MERKIGEIFEFDGVKLQVVESSNCGLNNTSCYFSDDEIDCEPHMCSAFQRKDKTSVKFIKIEDKTIKPTKEELIRHCEKQIASHKNSPTRFSERIMNEHKVFLKLLKGRNINEIFDEKGEYIENQLLKKIKLMTIEEAKRRSELYSALADGKTIQILNMEGNWVDVKPEELNYIPEELAFRIKPEPKCRPFKTQEECWEEMHKHPDFGWVTDGYYKSTISVKSDSIVVTISSLEYDFGKAYIHFTFADGTPFGIKEE